MGPAAARARSEVAWLETLLLPLRADDDWSASAHTLCAHTDQARHGPRFNTGRASYMAHLWTVCSGAAADAGGPQGMPLVPPHEVEREQPVPGPVQRGGG